MSDIQSNRFPYRAFSFSASFDGGFGGVVAACARYALERSSGIFRRGEKLPRASGEAGSQSMVRS